MHIGYGRTLLETQDDVAMARNMSDERESRDAFPLFFPRLAEIEQNSPTPVHLE